MVSSWVRPVVARRLAPQFRGIGEICLAGQQDHRARWPGRHRPVRLRVGDLPTQDRHLVPQYQDLRVLGGLTARQEDQPAEHAGTEEVDQAK